MQPDLEQLRGFAEDYTAAWCSMDPVAVAAHYAPEGSLAVNGGAPAVGREALAEVAAAYYRDLPDMQVFFRDLVVDGDRIEFHWTFTGTNTGPGGTGKAVRIGRLRVAGRSTRMASSPPRSGATIARRGVARQLASGV